MSWLPEWLLYLQEDLCSTELGKTLFTAETNNSCIMTGWQVASIIKPTRITNFDVTIPRSAFQKISVHTDERSDTNKKRLLVCSYFLKVMRNQIWFTNSVRPKCWNSWEVINIRPWLPFVKYRLSRLFVLALAPLIIININVSRRKLVTVHTNGITPLISLPRPTHLKASRMFAFSVRGEDKQLLFTTVNFQLNVKLLQGTEANLLHLRTKNTEAGVYHIVTG